MARPTKQGIDYFPLDTQFDTKVELFVAEHGAEGLGILITIWQLIYSNEGYYAIDNDDLSLVVRRRTMADLTTIKRVIAGALSRLIFDFELHSKYNILTSKAIQKRFFTASKKKKEVFAVKNYLYMCISSVGNLVFDDGNATKEKEKEKEEKEYTSSGDEEGSKKGDFYLTKKKKKIIGQALIDFNEFWTVFGYAKGKADAADTWLSVYSPAVFQDILAGAAKEAAERPGKIKKGLTPIYPQGWLSGRRWEDTEASKCDTCRYKVVEKLMCWKERKQCSSYQPV